MEEAADTDIMEDMYRGYENLTDEEILLDIKEHNNKVALDYLINKYRNFVRAKARSYFLIGADREDIVQEGMIGFYKPSATSATTSSRRSALLRSSA